MPPDEAQQQAQAQVQPQLDRSSSTQITQKSDDQRKQADQPATDPRLQDLRDDIEKTTGVDERHRSRSSTTRAPRR